MGQSAHYAKSPIGLFVFGDDGELSYFKLFSKSPERAVDEFTKSTEADVKGLKNVKESDFAYTLLRQRFREYAKDLGFVESDTDLNHFLSNFGYLLSKKKLFGIIGRDRIVIQASNALEDLGRVINLFQERLYEWFSLHYPEMKNTRDLAERVASYGRRENFPEYKDSTGAEIVESDEKIFTLFAGQINRLLADKKSMEDYIKNTMKEIAPNTSSIVDPILAAKLLSYAGSLEKLSRMPASTIQLLGAEKALFRHLHKKGKSPKYGIIFTAPAVQSASQDNKGKAARLISAKLMMAARIDYYSGRYDERLRTELDEELKKI
jgi:nucleolar protein 56